MGIIKKSLIFLLPLIFIFLLWNSSNVSAQEVTPTLTPENSKAKEDLQNKIKELEGKVSELKNKENTLSSQIDMMDNQIKLTEYRMNATNQQIKELTEDIASAGKRMKNLEVSLTDVTKVLINRIAATYRAGVPSPFEVLLTSSNARDFISRANYLRIVQEHDKRLIYDTQQARNDYANQKTIMEDERKKIESLQKQLEEYSSQIDQQKNEKEKLLSETQGDEENYQRLLSQAKAQLAGFSRFTASQGGASLLSGQTVCNDWGCYYNQRDSQWGSSSLNGTQYTLASDGCLVTSMAMIYTHYGHRSVTPVTINSNPNNFASYYPAYLKYTITADGATSSRVGALVDGELSNGNPVVVGISYDGGPSSDHFLVLVSGSNGNYMMNDPYTPNGHNIPFTDKYSVGSIREVHKTVF